MLGKGGVDVLEIVGEESRYPCPCWCVRESSHYSHRLGEICHSSGWVVVPEGQDIAVIAERVDDALRR